MFYTQPANVVFSFIEHAIMELALQDAQTEDALTNMRTQFKRQIKDSWMDSGTSDRDRVKPMPTNYIQPDETGYPGLEAPVG